MADPYLPMMLMAREGARRLPDVNMGLDRDASANPFVSGMQSMASLQAQNIANHDNADVAKLNDLKVQQTQEAIKQQQAMQVGTSALLSGNTTAYNAWKQSNPMLAPQVETAVINQQAAQMKAATARNKQIANLYPTYQSYNQAMSNGSFAKQFPGVMPPPSFTNQTDYKAYVDGNMTLDASTKFNADNLVKLAQEMHDPHNTPEEQAAAAQQYKLAVQNLQSTAAAQRNLAQYHTLTGQAALMNAKSNAVKAQAALQNAGTNQQKASQAKATSKNLPVNPTTLLYQAGESVRGDPNFQGLSSDQPNMPGTGDMSVAAAWVNAHAVAAVNASDGKLQYAEALNNARAQAYDHINIPIAKTNVFGVGFGSARPQPGKPQWSSLSPKVPDSVLLSDPRALAQYMAQYHSLPLPVYKALAAKGAFGG